MRTVRPLALWLIFLGCGISARAQVPPLEIQQALTPYNHQSYRGVPISSTAGDPAGSDGRAPTVEQQAGWGLTTTVPTVGQFRSWVGFGALAVPANPERYVEGGDYGDNAINTGLPVGQAGSTLVAVMKTAVVGAPYVSRQVSFLFGSVMPVPDTDENGVLLSLRSPSVRPEDYWMAEPYWTDKDFNGYHTNAPYYWSPNARVVFAVQPGPVLITWKKAQPTLTPPADPENYSLESGAYYRLNPVRYIVSGSAAKTPRRIYWTRGVFQNTGKPVTVPTARVGAVRVVYNPNFPAQVESEYVAPGTQPVTDAPGLEEKRTLWYDSQQGQIHAYNREGRAFVEFLGDLREDGYSRNHLGFEIVDVFKQPNPADVTIELGDPIRAWEDGRDDSELKPEMLLSATASSFAFEHSTSGRTIFYAIRETQNLNDFFLYWMEQGELGLYWPLRLVRYALRWPADPSRYSHYVRPLVATEAEASLTAVSLPLDNVPTIDYQDPLDQPRAHLTLDFKFYTFLEPACPAHRTLLRLSAGFNVTFERVFSWLDGNLISNQFAGTVATNLSVWDTNTQTLVWADPLSSPRVVEQTVDVGRRIAAPAGELGALAGSEYLAGHLHIEAGTSYNPHAYINPFAAGFEAANQGAIIPVNAIPGANLLEVYWFRKNTPDTSQGFRATCWPSVIGRYTIQWPANPREIVLASNDGSGGLPSLEAKGSIYYQNDPAQHGYNPNEEHALMLAGQAYALRDDLNVTAGAGYSSDPFVLIEYAESDGRPAMSAFRVLREKPSAGILFDYLVEAGTLLQAPMPLPLIEKPVEGAGAAAVNYNTEPPVTGGDLPGQWDPAIHANGPFAHYPRFTYQDRKHSFWVYRGLHAGPPPLEAGFYNTNTAAFEPPPAATAVVGVPFRYSLHASRLAASLTLQAAPGTPWPGWLRIEGLDLEGTPGSSDVGSLTLHLRLEAVDDGSQIDLDLDIETVASGSVVTQEPLAITSYNPYSNADVTFVDRPPYLADSPSPTNSFTMRFYYKTREGFAWPGAGTPPPVGSIVPYLRPQNAQGVYVGDAGSKNTAALDIVYRPFWPYEDTKLPKLNLGDTLTTPKNNLPAVRGQTSLQILYQQSIALDLDQAHVSATLHDATREKFYDIALQGLDRLPGGVLTETYQGKLFFPNLPPHLAQRLFFDPNRGSKGHLVFRGQYQDEPVGEKYVLLNVLRGADLESVQGLCPAADADKGKWDAAVAGLSTQLETFIEDPAVPGSYIPDPNLTVAIGVGDLAEIANDDTAVDSYALSACGPGVGYLTLIAGNGLAFTPPGEPVSVHVIKVRPPMHVGEVKVIAAANPLSEMVTFQHTADLGGRFDEFEYEWRIAPPVDGLPPAVTPGMDAWTLLVAAVDQPRYTLGGAGIQALSDNYIVMRYRPIHPDHPLLNQWSAWTEPQLAEGWIKRVLAGINPFNQRVYDLYNNQVNTDVSLLTQAGARWEGDVALSLENIDDFGLIEIYETVLNRGRMLSIDAGINYGPANDALLLAAGYINDLYMTLGNEAWADAANPTIGIGTKDHTYSDIATALFAFKGQAASLLEEELALLRGRDDFLQPGVETPPVYNRFFWNYTRGIDAGEVIYALNYNIQENPNAEVDGIVNAADARRMFPQGHGDAYGHYLTALKGYYSLLLDTDFDWVPRTEAVTVLGKPVQVDYLDERKFASAAAAAVRAGRQVFDLTWRKDYQPNAAGWEHFAATRTNDLRDLDSTRFWGLDHWASRASQGAYLHWIVGNAILPDFDSDPSHEGIQRIDRTTVPELQELPSLAKDLQTSLDSAEGGLSPLGLPSDAVVFDINPSQVLGADNATHFEQVYQRALGALQNAIAAFDDAKDVTRLMRSEQDSLVELQEQVQRQEWAFESSLIELYGTPYPDDIGPGRTWKQGYKGPDLIHYTYVDLPEIVFPELWNHTETTTYFIDLNDVPEDWTGTLYTNFNFIVKTDDEENYAATNPIEFNLGPHGYSDKPATWTGQRAHPGAIQQAISEFILAHRRLKQALYDNAGGKADLDKAIRLFESQKSVLEQVSQLEQENLDLENDISELESNYEVLSKDLETAMSVADMIKDSLLQDLPESSIFGTAFGGDTMFPVRIGICAAYMASKLAMLTADAARHRVVKADIQEKRDSILEKAKSINNKQLAQALQDGVYALFKQLEEVQAALETIDVRLREFDDAERKIRALIAQGERIQEEREIYRRRAAAIIQGYRTRDAAFRIFRNEKLERYKTLFDLAARYSLLAANAYDYETGLLDTTQGRSFVSRITSARALGVVRDGQPQFAGSSTGDPGLSSVLAEMKADWDVLKGRLGFNNPDAYGTTVSLRAENFRILPGTDGDQAWQDVLHAARKENLLEDKDVQRYCLQISRGDSLPVPGILLEFDSTIAHGYNWFGEALASGDHGFTPSSFATKIHAVGVALEGYRGMDDPSANSSAVQFAGGSSPADPSLAFLDPLGLSATPYVYLIPAGVDSMRTPPLGDSSAIRTWSVHDVTIPLPFNIGASDFSAFSGWQSSDFLSEPLFGVRKHQAFRPVSSAAVFSPDFFGSTGQIVPSQFTSRRLIGRSVWNSKWKLIIPGHTLLNDPSQGLDRFIHTVQDIKLHLVTYSYAGN